METMPVIFRIKRGKQYEIDGVTAVFPTEPHDRQGCYMTCYAHVGQHGSCTLDWYRTTRPATEAEYSSLLRELRRIYEVDRGDGVYKLKVYRRMTRQHMQLFNAEVRRLNSASRALTQSYMQGVE